MTTTIYSLRDETGLTRYIGKTVRPISVRLKCHINEAKRGNELYKNRWVRKLLEAGYKPSIAPIETVNGDGNKEEMFWIAMMRAMNWPLVNIAAGGGGTTGAVPSKEKREQLSKALKGHPVSESTKELIRIARAKQAPIIRTPLSEESKQKMRESASLKDVSEKKRVAMKEWWRLNRAGFCAKFGVICVETGETFMSAAEAAQWCNGDQNAISKACKKGTRHKKYHWTRLTLSEYEAKKDSEFPLLKYL